MGAPSKVPAHRWRFSYWVSTVGTREPEGRFVDWWGWIDHRHQRVASPFSRERHRVQDPLPPPPDMCVSEWKEAPSILGAAGIPPPCRAPSTSKN